MLTVISCWLKMSACVAFFVNINDWSKVWSHEILLLENKTGLNFFLNVNLMLYLKVVRKKRIDDQNGPSTIRECYHEVNMCT